MRTQTVAENTAADYTCHDELRIKIANSAPVEVL